MMPLPSKPPILRRHRAAPSNATVTPPNSPPTTDIDTQAVATPPPISQPAEPTSHPDNLTISDKDNVLELVKEEAIRKTAQGILPSTALVSVVRPTYYERTKGKYNIRDFQNMRKLLTYDEFDEIFEHILTHERAKKVYETIKAIRDSRPKR